MTTKTEDYTVSNLASLGLSTDRIEFVQAALAATHAPHVITPEDARRCVEIMLELIALRQDERDQQRHVLNRLRAVDESMRGFRRIVSEALDVAEGRVPVPEDEG